MSDTRHSVGQNHCNCVLPGPTEEELITLPGPQPELEADYKEALQRDFGIVFNCLYTITNQPIARFADDLRKQGKWDEYMDLLVTYFLPGTVVSDRYRLVGMLG